MDKNDWSVGKAKQQFSEVLRRSAKKPQLIYRRNRLIAAVVAVDEAKAEQLTKEVTLGERFAEARELFEQEQYVLPRVRRRNRPNDFVKALDAVAPSIQTF